MPGSVQPTGVKSASQAKAALAARLSTVTWLGGLRLRAAWNSAAASVAAATDATARPVTSKTEGSTWGGPLTVRLPSPAESPAASQIRSVIRVKSSVMTSILRLAGLDNQR